jgi:carbon storage regulator
MLVLTRKRMESIAIGDRIRITVVKLDRNQVRLGIEAPEDLVVLREELLREQEGQGVTQAGRAFNPAPPED